MIHILNLKLVCLLIGSAEVITFLYLKKISQILMFFVFTQSFCVVIMICTWSLEIFYPLLLLNGPILYLIHSRNISVSISLIAKIIHVLPLMCAALIYGFYYGFKTGDHYSITFYSLSTILASFSQIIYAALICAQINKKRIEKNPLSFRLTQLCYILIINGMVVIWPTLSIFGIHCNPGFNINSLGYLTLILSVIVIIKDIISDTKGLIKIRKFGFANFYQSTSGTYINHKPYQYSPLEFETIKIIETKVHSFLETEKAYLLSNITLDSVSAQLNISKNHLSQVFNIYMNKGFYRILAEYRIRYALEILHNNNNLKIEALAYDSGFNSLSSFNRYFKEIVGMKPSAYIEALNE